MMRTESNLARGVFPQLRIALLHGLTWKLFALYYEIETIKAELEVGYVITLPIFHVMDCLFQLQVDKQLLRIGSIARTPVPSPADGEQS